MTLHVAATYKIFYGYLHGRFPNRRVGVQSSDGAILFFFFFFLFCFVLFAKHLLYHTRALNAPPINATSNLFCLFALRFSVPVNNFMSCVAEPPHPGHKAILWDVNMSYKVTTWNVNRTQDLSFRSPMFYHLPIALSCKIQLSGLGRVRQYMCVYMSASATYT